MIYILFWVGEMYYCVVWLGLGLLCEWTLGEDW